MIVDSDKELASERECLEMAEPSRAWAIRPSRKEEEKHYAPLFWQKGVAAIDYLGGNGPDLRDCDEPHLRKAVRKAKEEEKLSTRESAVGKVVNQLCRFANEIRRGDWILSPRSKPGDVMIGRCSSTYEYAPGRLDKNQFPYIIGVDWYVDIPRDWLSEDLQSRIGGSKFNGLSLWEIDGKHIPELESMCKLAIEHRNVPVNLPGYLVDGVDELVGERGRSHFIVYVVLKELEETEKIRKEKEEPGEEFHPDWETSAMVYAWVRASRDLDNERLVEKWGGKVSL